ncbi:MAG: hypothetical protein WCJ33_03620, partial [Pseudomonadota bacterium]
QEGGIAIVDKQSGILFKGDLLEKLLGKKDAEKKPRGFGFVDNKSELRHNFNSLFRMSSIFFDFTIPASFDFVTGFEQDLENYKLLQLANQENYRISKILATIDIALHKNPELYQRISDAAPLLVQFHNEVIKWLEQRTEALQKTPLYDPFFDPARLITLETETKVNKSFAPQPFTAEEKEQKLINEIKPFIEEALEQDPTFNQFKCSLLPNSYDFKMTLRNKDGSDIESKISLQADNFDEAIDLKKRLQSHILNHQGIVPLYLRPQNPDRTTTTIEGFVPNIAPDKIELCEVGEDRHKHYAARVEFTLMHGETGEMIIPLGLNYEPANLQEAESRLNHLSNYIAELRNINRWETVGEVTRDLRNFALTNETKKGWRVADTIKLENYELVNLDLPSTDPNSQSTKIKSAKLKLMDKSNSGTNNPYWRLSYTISVQEANGDIKECESTLHLQTTDEDVAKTRGGEAMNFLVEEFARLREKFTDLRWVIDKDCSEPGNFELQLKDGSSLSLPEPHNLAHVIDDIPSPNLNFSIVHNIDRDANKITFCCMRGGETEKLVGFKGVAGLELIRTFKIGEENNPDQIAQNVVETFRRFIQDSYSSRTEDDLRKKPKEFQPVTIQSAFNEAIKTHTVNMEEKRLIVQHKGNTIAI